MLPVKLIVEALCTKDSNLITANATINFMLQSLKDQNTPLSEELYSALEIYIQERRSEQQQIYLHNYNDFKRENDKEEYRLLLTVLPTSVDAQKEHFQLQLICAQKYVPDLLTVQYTLNYVTINFFFYDHIWTNGGLKVKRGKISDAEFDAARVPLCRVSLWMVYRSQTFKNGYLRESTVVA